MRNILLAALAASALVVPASIASADDTAPEKAAPSCPQKNFINRYADGDEEGTIIVWTRPRVGYKVTFISCPRLEWTGLTARIETGGAGCLGPGDRIVFDSGAVGSRESCVVAKVEPLPPKKPADEEQPN